MSKEWKLPDGLGVRVNGDGVHVLYPSSKKWVTLCVSLDRAEDLLAVLSIEVPRARAAMSGSTNTRHGK